MTSRKRFPIPIVADNLGGGKIGFFCAKYHIVLSFCKGCKSPPQLADKAIIRCHTSLLILLDFTNSDHWLVLLGAMEEYKMKERLEN